MAKINSHYQKLQAGYLFPEIGRRVRQFALANPSAKMIRLGIGDVVLPLPPAIIEAFHSAVDEMGQANSFRGYGPEQGYDFLISAIITHEYEARGVKIKPQEVFVSDGSKCDTGNIGEIFSLENKIAVTDPVYPVYVDTNVMAGRTGNMGPQGHYSGLIYLAATEANGFSPALPKERADIIYLCSPNNPTGTVLSREALAQWVRYARENQSVIFFDAAYEAFITDESLPHSIYEIDGADEVAIEFRSYSKKAGFTGTRCAFTVVPEKLRGRDEAGREVSINQLWQRRHTTKFNGVSYPVQRAAAACYTSEGKKQLAEIIDYYMTNAALMRQSLGQAGFTCYGGIHAPYLWLKTPGTLDSWSFFDRLLRTANIVGTPGAGFGPAGEGYFRLSAFASREAVEEAMERMTRLAPLC